MKQIILSLIAICSVFAAKAQSCVTLQQVSANYATNQVTFDLKWGTCNNANHLYRVWVFVDYRPIMSETLKGTWIRATINATDKGTLVSANKGVWVTGSANATQRVTLTLDIIPSRFDWCAFAIDYPPNATLSNGSYTLKGTPPFMLNGNTEWNAKTYTGNITAITDATNNPEGFVNIPGCSTERIALGTVGFASVQTWVVGAQTWSAAVTATYCNKSTYNSPVSAPFRSDCYKYSVNQRFSWCMLAQYAAQLCPSPWRVPGFDDFCTLDKTLNNRSDCADREYYSSTDYYNYLNKWGASANENHCDVYLCPTYWSSSETSATTAGRLMIGGGGYDTGSTRLRFDANKGGLMELRCVK